MKTVRILAFVVLAAMLMLNVSAQDAPKLKVAASFSILADVVQQVGGDTVEVISIVPNGQDPHDYEPSASEVAAFSDARVTFINGGGFEGGVLNIITNAAPDMDVRVASSCVQILPFMMDGHDHEHEEGEEHNDEHSESSSEAAVDDGAMTALCEKYVSEMEALHAKTHEDGEAHDHEGEETHEHAEGEEHSHAEPLGYLYAIACEDSHEEGACDMHVWSEPHNVMYWAMYIRDVLSELDPANAEAYAANAAAYIEELDHLSHHFVMESVASVPEDARVLVTNHATLGYFAAKYDFEVVGTVIPSASTAAEPSAGEVAALVDVIREEGAQAVFADSTVNTRLAEQVAAEAGIQFIRLYTDSLPQDGGYLDYVRYNVSAIVTALGGTPSADEE